MATVTPPRKLSLVDNGTYNRSHKEFTHMDSVPHEDANVHLEQPEVMAEMLAHDERGYAGDDDRYYGGAQEYFANPAERTDYLAVFYSTRRS